MMKGQSAAKGFTILGASGIINKILAIIYVPVLTLLIGDAGNGIYNAGYTMYLLVFVITNMGIPVAISKLVSEQVALGRYEDSLKTLRVSGTMLVTLGLLTTILTAMFARWLSYVVGRPEAYLTILALSPTMLFTAISSTFRGFFQGRSNMAPTGMSQILEQLINSVFTVLFAWLMLRYGLQYAASHGIVDPKMVQLTQLKFAAAGGTIGTSVGALGSALFLMITFLRNHREFKEEVREEKKNRSHQEGMHDTVATAREIGLRILQYAVPITLGAAAVYTANLVDLKYTNERLLAAGFTSFQAASLYGILTTQYQKIINIPLAMASALSAAIIPGISAAAAREDHPLLNRRINESFRAIFMITIPAAVGLGVLAKPVIALLFPRNIHGYELMMMGSGVLVLISMVQIQTAALQGIGKTHIPTIHMVFALLVKIIINYNLIAIKSINIKGAVIGSIVCYSIAGFLNYRSLKKHTRVSLQYRRIFNRPLVASLLMGAGVYGCYHILYWLLYRIIPSFLLVNLVCTAASTALGGILFFIIMYRTRGITPEDLRKLPMNQRIKALAGKTKIGRKIIQFMTRPISYREMRK